MKRRGFIFTLDALLALVLVMVVITSVSVFTTNINVYGTYLREQEKFAAEDALIMYKTVPLRNLVPPGLLEDWILNGIVDEDFVSPDMPPLEIVATYWSLDPLFPDRNLVHKAEVILGTLLNITLKGYNYELLIENYTSPWLRKGDATDYSKARDVSAATLILSGYEFNQTPRGYVARAYLTRLTNRNASYMYFIDAVNSTVSPQENVSITFLVPNEEENLLPPDANITRVKLFFEPLDENSVIKLYIDGEPVTCGGLIADTFQPYSNLKYKMPLDDEDCNMLDILKEKADLNQHEFKIVISNTANPGIRPNGYVVIEYTTARMSVINYPKTFYFDGIETNGSFEIANGVFIPGNLTSVNVIIKLNDSSLRPSLSIIFLNETIDIGPPDSNSGTDGVYQWDNSSISSKLSNGISYANLSGKYVWFKIKVDNSNGAFIQLDPRNSFVKIEYTPLIQKTIYTLDKIDVMSVPELSSDSQIVWNLSIPSYAVPLWGRFNFVLDSAEIQSLKVSKGSMDNWSEVLNSSTITNLTSTRIILTDLSRGENYVKIIGNNLSQLKNYSIGELVYFVNVYVPYGEIKPFLLQNYSEVRAYNLTYNYIGGKRHVFVGDKQAINEGKYMNIRVEELNPEEYAVDDAIIRLFEILGGTGSENDPIDVDIGDTKISFASLEGIPKVIKPIVITLRVWREG